MTLIIAKPEATAAQMAQYLTKTNPNPKLTRNITPLELAQIFLDECSKEGVRGDVAFAQSCKETNFFRFTGDVDYDQNNFAGLGATGRGKKGCVFPDIETGVLAQAQHLKSYATKDALNCENVDPRRTAWFMRTKGGTSPDVETLGGTWAVPGYDTSKYPSLEAANEAGESYGYNIVNMVKDMLKIKVNNNDNGDKPQPSNSPLVSYVQISPNRTSPRQDEIDTITIHCVVGQVTVERLGAIFASSNRKASSNYGVGSDGRIGMYCEEKDRSWCTGGTLRANGMSGSQNDHRAITIEVASGTTAPYAVTDAALNSLIKLCADICKRNPGIKYLKWQSNKSLVGDVSKQNMTVHRWFATKSCPGDYLYARQGYIADSANKLLGVTTNYAKYDSVKVNVPVDRNYLMKGDKSKEVGVLQTNLNYLGYICGSVDNSFGDKTEAALIKFQKANGLDDDGKYGPESKVKLEALVAAKKDEENKSQKVETYTVQKGDTLAKIGTKVGVPWKTIATINNIPSPYVIKIGQVLRLSKTASSSTPITGNTKLVKNGYDYSLVFDANYYCNKYADVKKVVGTSESKLFNHFLTYGMKEGRQGISTFNVEVYKNRYADLRNIFDNDLPKYYHHYIKYGKKEGRQAI